MDKVTNRQLYDAIQSVEDKIDKLADERIRPLERAIDKIYIYGSLAVIGFGIGVQLATAWVQKHLGL